MSLFRVSNHGLVPFRRRDSVDHAEQPGDNALADAVWADLSAITGDRLFAICPRLQLADSSDDETTPAMVALDLHGNVVIIYVRDKFDRDSMGECLSAIGWARSTSISELARLYFDGGEEFWRGWQRFAGSAAPPMVGRQPRLAIIASEFPAAAMNTLEFLAEHDLPLAVMQAQLFVGSEGEEILQIQRGLRGMGAAPRLVSSRDAAPSFADRVALTSQPKLIEQPAAVEKLDNVPGRDRPRARQNRDEPADRELLQHGLGDFQPDVAVLGREDTGAAASAHHHRVGGDESPSALVDSPSVAEELPVEQLAGAREVEQSGPSNALVDSTEERPALSAAQSSGRRDGRPMIDRVEVVDAVPPPAHHNGHSVSDRATGELPRFEPSNGGSPASQDTEPTRERRVSPRPNRAGDAGQARRTHSEPDRAQQAVDELMRRASRESELRKQRQHDTDPQSALAEEPTLRPGDLKAVVEQQRLAQQINGDAHGRGGPGEESYLDESHQGSLGTDSHAYRPPRSNLSGDKPRHNDRRPDVPGHDAVARHNGVPGSVNGDGGQLGYHYGYDDISGHDVRRGDELAHDSGRGDAPSHNSREDAPVRFDNHRSETHRPRPNAPTSQAPNHGSHFDDPLTGNRMPDNLIDSPPPVSMHPVSAHPTSGHPAPTHADPIVDGAGSIDRVQSGAIHPVSSHPVSGPTNSGYPIEEPMPPSPRSSREIDPLSDTLVRVATANGSRLTGTPPG